LHKKCSALWKRLTSSEDEDEITLEPVREFFESYIGVFIVGFIAFGEDIQDLETDTAAKMIIGTEIREDELYLKLSTLNSKYGGYLKISPQINGQFAERSKEDQPAMDSRYRINFYGGDCIEYMDSDEVGNISFHHGHLK
jgi:hypothetical protein